MIAMKICFLGRLGAKITGIGRYTTNLIESIVHTPGNEYFAINDSHFKKVHNLDLLATRDNKIVRIAHNMFILPFHIRKYKFDIIHGTTSWLPFFSSGAKEVITIHDLTPLLFPHLHTTDAVLRFGCFLRQMAKRSRLVLADSENTRRDIISCLRIKPEKVRTIHLGVEHERFREIGDDAVLGAVRKKYALPEEFLLYLGTIEPRKNIAGLLRAYKMALSKSKLPMLVLAGQKGWGYEEVFSILGNDAVLRKTVRYLDYVDDVDIPALYNMAEAFIYPSFYEGFGLPVLEAMACGTPVITSNRSSLPEVVGGAGIMLDPGNEQAMADAISWLADDESLRKDLSRKGMKQASLFSWDKTAKETLSAYEYVLRK